MELYVYKGEFKLPSIDLDCMRVLMYVKLADVKSIKIRNNCSPFHSDNGFLPYLIDTSDNNRKYSGYEKIINFFKGIGFTLEESEKNEACLSYIRQNLYPYYMYQLFGNPQNIDDSRALYATRTPFPFNFYYPSKYIKKTEEVCQAVANFSLEDPITQHDTTEMEHKAKKCLNWISEKLSTKEFFLGQQCEVDATIYAYLAIILRFQLPNNQLQSHIKQCDNLVRYVNDLSKKFFSDDEIFESEKAKEQSQKKEQKVFTGQEEDGTPAEIRKRYLLSGIVATAAMLMFAHFHGIFSIALAEKLNETGTTFSDYNTDYVGDDEE